MGTPLTRANLGDPVTGHLRHDCTRLFAGQTAGQALDWLLTGLLLGAGAGAVVALAGLLWLGHVRLAVCLAGGISGGVAGAAVLGLAAPVVLRLLRLEPRVAAGPMALAGADVITILVYFNLARWLLG